MAIYIIYNLMYNIKAAWSLRYEPSLLQTGRVLFYLFGPRGKISAAAAAPCPSQDVVDGPG